MATLLPSKSDGEEGLQPSEWNHRKYGHYRVRRDDGRPNGVCAYSHIHDRSGIADISFYRDDIEASVSELRSRGVEFTQDVTNEGYELATNTKVPGGFSVQLDQPKYSR